MVGESTLHYSGGVVVLLAVVVVLLKVVTVVVVLVVVGGEHKGRSPLLPTGLNHHPYQTPLT